ncbi:MAG TPA: hypothetical protein VIJ78_06405 [Pseudolabrys sp.]
MTKLNTFGLAFIATIMALTAALAQATASEYSYPPLSYAGHQYYQQHPDEFQQLLEALPPVSHTLVRSNMLAPGMVPSPVAGRR